MSYVCVVERRGLCDGERIVKDEGEVCAGYK